VGETNLENKMSKKIKFEAGSAYLMRHKHYAFGGAPFVAVIGFIDRSHVMINGRIHNLAPYLESREVVKCLGEVEDDSLTQFKIEVPE
jgi:hypothetical protein